MYCQYYTIQFQLKITITHNGWLQVYSLIVHYHTDVCVCVCQYTLPTVANSYTLLPSYHQLLLTVAPSIYSISWPYQHSVIATVHIIIHLDNCKNITSFRILIYNIETILDAYNSGTICSHQLWLSSPKDDVTMYLSLQPFLLITTDNNDVAGNHYNNTYTTKLIHAQDMYWEE